MRWDNSPHFPRLENFPHHFHDEAGNTQSGNLPGEIPRDLRIVLNEVKKYYNLKVNK